MYRSLLVPLDRSSLAEQALPLALGIARRAGARLDLVAVHAHYALEDRHAGWVPCDRWQDAEWKRQERDYLEATARWLALVSPVAITTAVLPGSNALAEFVADGIIEQARACGTDLIVVTTHARGPLNRLVFGSVADVLVRRAGVPVLVLPPREMAPAVIPEPSLNEVLIPLDGSPLAEQALAPALELARLLEAPCGLLRVVQPHSSGRGSGDLPEVAKAEEYLGGVAAHLREGGLRVRTQVVVARHAAEAIRKVAAAQTDSLIALATHGRAGLSRLLLGSVAGKLIRAATSPLLVYRPAGRRKPARAGAAAEVTTDESPGAASVWVMR
jgi:nucleotide-binding universal stress UspA family protein